MAKPRKQSRSVTLKDIAAATGVSVNTVSRALRDKEDIAEKTRVRIRRTATKMGYVNNMIASSLRLGYTNTIAVLLGDISNPFFGVLMKNIESRARMLGYASFLINTGEDDGIEREAIRTALNKNVDGIIVCPSQQREDNLRYLMRCGTPFVLVGRHFPAIPTDYVACDDELGGYLATRELIARGHRKIMLVNGPRYISSARARLAGYRRALKDAGIPFVKSRVREVSLAADDYGEIADGLGSGRCGCTAVFAFSDLIALGLWASFRDRGIRVPEDCSLIGFDSIHTPLSAPFTLASLAYLVEGMGEKAVDLLVGKIRGNHPKPKGVIIKPRLVRGETIAPPREPRPH